VEMPDGRHVASVSRGIAFFGAAGSWLKR
jgi:hypothetical protein